MNKIVNIKGIIESKKQERQRELHRGKVEAIQKVMQCSSCPLKCAMCGLHLSETDSSHISAPTLGYSFCESSRKEFEDFLSISSGKKRPDLFWHNKEWIHMWSAWLNYQQAISGFINSTEIKSFLEEFKPEE